MLGNSLTRVSSDKVLLVVAVSIWNVTGVNYFVPSCRQGQGNKVLFLCMVCADTVVFAVFPGSSTVLGSHQCSIPQGDHHLSSAADVRFLHEGVSVGTGHEVFFGLNPCPELAIGKFSVAVLVEGGPVFRQTLKKWLLIPHLVQVLPFAGHVFQA